MLPMVTSHAVNYLSAVPLLFADTPFSICSGTPLQHTPLGTNILSLIARCPSLRGFSGSMVLHNREIKVQML